MFGPTQASASDLGEVLDFLRLLWAVEHRLKSASKQMEQRLGVTGPQRLVLRIVQQFPGISATKLAGVVQLHPSTLTGIIARLRRRGLLACDRDFSDRRRMRLSVRSNSTTRRQKGASAATVEAAVASALKRVPRRKVQHAKDVLLEIVAALEQSSHASHAPHHAAVAFMVDSARTPPRRHARMKRRVM